MLSRTGSIVAIGALAGLAASAWGQGVSLSFSADQTVVERGDTIHWVVTASFTGFDDPTAYFAGFIGVFYASDESVGLASNPTCSMMVATDPIISGATIGNVDIFCWAGLGNNDPSNPINIYEFDVDVPAFRGELPYEPVGVACVFASDEWMINSDDFDLFGIQSDTVTIGHGCGPADLAEPWGVLDNADISAFVTMFLGDDPAVDYDENSIYDLADVVGFINAFTAGCP